MENLTEIGYIYALCDPDTGLEMYIGKTVSPKKRYRSHFSNSELKRPHPKVCWIKRLLREGKKPSLKILKVCRLEELQRNEIGYIAAYRKINPKLKVENGT